MQLARKILKRFNGFHYPQEYLCMPSAFPALKVYLLAENIFIADITTLHCFTGYHPLIIVLPASVHEKLPGTTGIELVFSPHDYNGNVGLLKKDAPARLVLEKINNISATGTGMFFYRGKRGTHRFTGALQQYMGEMENRFFARKPGNVFLEGNLLKQVQIAYAIPRNICIATVGNTKACNFFPTDLHGSVEPGKYIVSLRHEGKACAQVMEAGQMVVAEVNAHAYKKVYALGKNHMKELQPSDVFETRELPSKNFGIPLHEETVGYRELQLEDSFIYGIHRLLIFRVVHHQMFHPGTPSLQHIHNCSATWQWKQGREGNYLLR